MEYATRPCRPQQKHACWAGPGQAGPGRARPGQAGPGRAPQASSGCLGLANFLPPDGLAAPVVTAAGQAQRLASQVHWSSALTAARGCRVPFGQLAVASPTRRAAVDGATSQLAGRQSGPARPASVRCGPAWRAPIRSGLVPSGPDRSSPVRSSLVRLGPAWAPFGQRAVASPTCCPPAPSVELLASGPAD